MSKLDRNYLINDLDHSTLSECKNLCDVDYDCITLKYDELYPNSCKLYSQTLGTSMVDKYEYSTTCTKISCKYLERVPHF